MYTPLSAYRSGSAGMMVVIYAYLFHSDRKITCNNRYIQISALFYALCHVINRVLGISKIFVLSLQQKSDFRYLMEETKYNGPEMNSRKLFVLILTAALILMLFLTRPGNTDSLSDSDKGTTQQLTEQYLYISPFDSLFRLYADSVCDWKMLAAIAYVESKFDTTAKSHVGAMGLMQIMPATYHHMLAKMDVPDTMAQNVELDVRVAVRYLDELSGLFSFINENERINYMLASYNGGSNHIFDAMRLARKYGVNRYSWSSLRPILESLSDSAVYNDSVCLFGKFDATETVNYVNRVNRKYKEYRSQELMFLALEKYAENNK